MHEMHLITDLLDDILKFAEKDKAKKVTNIYIKMGEFTEINPEILKYYFMNHSKGTIAEGAVVHIEHSDARELRLISFDCE